jgi:hypothetical protein
MIGATKYIHKVILTVGFRFKVGLTITVAEKVLCM